MTTRKVYTNKAALYARYRWNYAAQAIQTIAEATGMGPETVMADIGAGTGILTRHYVSKVGKIYAVEINAEMRREAAAYLGETANCTLLNTTAEETSLPDQSVDVITVAQAIHWFNPEPTRREFSRILKPGGWLAILHNNSTDPVQGQAVGAILTAENGVNTAGMTRPPYQAPMDFYYGGEHFSKYVFPFSLLDDWEHFFGGMCSASYMPDPDHPAFARLERAARGVFTRFCKDGFVTVQGETVLFLGQPG